MKKDPELEKLIPPLQEKEYKQLENNILEQGYRDDEPILLWNNIIIDGHHRKKICDKHNIKPPTKDMTDKFTSKQEVKVWMINNQKGRRNLTDGWKWELALVKKDLLMEKGREIKKEIGKKTGRGKELSDSDKTFDKHNSQKIMAEELGWSTGKVAKADKVWKEADEKTKEKIKDDEKSIDETYREIRKEEKKKQRKEKIRKQKEAIENGDVNLPEGKYEVIVIDPPWPYGRKYDPEGSRVANPYPEMEISELKELEIPATKDSIVWLWTTHKFIWEAKKLLETWGYDYKACLVWNKKKLGMGSWLRMQCEFCLLGIKGNPSIDLTNQRDIIHEKRQEHSKKPNKFYEMVEELCIGRKLDYFAREKRQGWDVYGDEVS